MRVVATVATVAILSVVAVAGFSDIPASAAIGYVYLPKVPLGASLAFYDLLGNIGFEGTVGTYSETAGNEHSRLVSGSLGINLHSPVEGLYPSLGVGVTHVSGTEDSFNTPNTCIQHSHDENNNPVPQCPEQQTTKVLEDSLEWSIDARVTYVLLSWIGLSVGYRATLPDPTRGSVILGASFVISPSLFQ